MSEFQAPYSQQGFYPPNQGQQFFQQRQQNPSSWFHAAVCLSVLFMCQQAYQFYQNQQKTELKIKKMQKLLHKKKTMMAKQAQENEKKIRQELYEREKIEQQIKKVSMTKELTSVSQAGSDGDNNSPSVIKGQESLIKINDQAKIHGQQAIRKVEQVMERAKSSVSYREIAGSKDRDSLSVQRRASVIEDPMVASANLRESNHRAQSSITRVCLTGGPCAGKTTALSTIRLRLEQIGYRVLLVPEAATILQEGGAFIQTPKMTLAFAVKFQISLMKLQMNLEDIFVEIAQASEIPTVIICDRGVMDGSAYCDENVWQAILDETGWSTIQLRDRRYEVVLHLVTAADGADKFYTSANNQARSESVQEAIELDRKLISAWVGHPHFSIIQNSAASFQDKIDKTLSTVLNFIGLPSPSACMNKFLLVSDQSNYDIKVPKSIKKEFFQLDDTFLQTDLVDGLSMVRKIGKNDSFIYSNEWRYLQNGEKIQKKKQITAREYIELLEMRDKSKKQVRKIRQCFIYERQYFMVESFMNVDGSPSILRIETTGEDQKISIPPFVEVLKEVSDAKVYDTVCMSDLAYKMPEADKGQIQQKLAERKKQQDAIKQQRNDEE